MALLPPKVVGPINEWSTVVGVVGVAPGASVQVFADGVAFGPVGVATEPTVGIHLGALRAVAGKGLTATQALGPETSDPSAIPEVVNASPSSLPPVVFLSQIHIAIDWVFIGNVIPGATVTVTHRGAKVGESTTMLNSASVRVKFGRAFNEGDTLVASQSFTPAGGPVVEGKEVESLPAEGRDLERLPAPPNVIRTPLECDLHVLLNGIEQGATAVVSTPSGTLFFPFSGATSDKHVPPLTVPGSVTVSQLFENHNLTSAPAPPVPISKAPPDPPRVLSPICPDARSVRVIGLHAGSEVDFEVWQEFIDNVTGNVSNDIAKVGKGWAWSDDCEFQMPKGLPDAIQALRALRAGTAGKSRLFMKALVKSCDGSGRAVESNEAPVAALANQAIAANVVGPLFACGRFVRVNNVNAGSVLTLHSDSRDAAQLGAPERVFTFEALLPCYRSLRAGESVTVTMSGCGDSSIGSAPSKVGALTTLKPPVVRSPVRPFDRGAWVDKVVPGARVSVFVQGLWRATVDSTSESVWVELGALNLKESVTALQVLCEHTSPVTPEGVSVSVGQMSARHDPSPLVRGGAGKPTRYAIRVQDKDTAAQVNGRAFINGVEFPIDVELATAFPPGQDGPPSFVRADGYADAPIVWHLVDPPAVSPAALTLDLTSPTGGSSINKVTWKVFSTSGLGHTQRTQIGSQTGATSKFTLLPPSAPGTEYLVECSAEVSLMNSNVNVAQIAASSNGFLNCTGIAWAGQDLAAHFRVQFDLVTDDGTGHPVFFPSIAFAGTTP